MQKVILYPYFLFTLLLLFAGCSEDMEQAPPSGTHDELMGRAVNFDASHAVPFATRVSYNHNGSFNEGDIMTIYRQYSNDGGLTFIPSTEAYRVYYYDYRKAVGSGVVLGHDWLVKKGEKGYDPERTPNEFVQTDADSLTWDNGKTVRFRAWSRSNLDDAIVRGSKGHYYPDYCVAEWVTVSGPTMAVPLTLKHQGCRIGFTTKSGNELVRAEICTDVEDYRRRDNSVMQEDDESSEEHGKTLEQAQREADAVKAVYDKMCMPAGISIETSLLSTMTQDLYTATSNFSKIHEKTTDEGIVVFNTKTADEIASEVQRPLFCSNNGRLYMISIPYDMSTADTRGESLRLPACTRFKVWLYDVNNGDRANTTDEEATYHIFSLADVMDKESGDDRRPLFPEGMELGGGISYLFSVGYHYDHLTITPADDFSWDLQDEEEGVRTDEANPIVAANTYTWWKDAIKNAIPKNISEKYDPQFHIDTEEEFLEFIKLVNGEAAGQTDGLTRMLRPEKTYNTSNPAKKDDYRWYRTTDINDKGHLVEGADSVTHDQAEAEGYIFYEHYYPADGDQAAYSEEDYLRGPFSFYDENLNEHFTVFIDADLDFRDQKLKTIGNTSSTPFRGVIEGFDETNKKIHTIKNIYMEGDDGAYMFGYCNDVAIRDLQIETVHDFMLVKQATAMNSQIGYGAYIVGVSIKAPSSGNPLAGTLSGSSYVVGCFYQGEAGGAMVGTADNLNMYGNMMAASGLASGTGALLGAYADPSKPFFAPQPEGHPLVWGRFMANYYDVELSPGTNAVGAIPDAYRPQEYIRGRRSWILKAKNNNLISGDVPFDQLPSEQMRQGYYGLAPWRAMNYAIWEYNVVGGKVSEVHNCKSHFVNNSTGYVHQYPQRVYGEPASADDETGNASDYRNMNLLEQFN